MTRRDTEGHGQTPVPLSASPGPDLLSEAMAETVLDNGVHVLSEHVPGVRSAAVGVWVRQGGAHETDDTTGVSHLLEHMVFKGTERRTAQQLALSIESLGGSLDAYTTREHTAYQARVLDEHLDTALDVLSDLVLHPKLVDQDLELERQVVLEEIAQVEDTPDDLVFETHSERMWRGHPYGRSILGSKESVASMSGDTLRTLHARRYCGEDLVVAAAGNVDHERFVGEVARLFGDSKSSGTSQAVEVPTGTRTGEDRLERETAQSHIVFGTRGPEHGHEDRYPVILLASALGGGMSSRLFQRVREELGLCYSVFTFHSFYSVAGSLGVYVGTRPATADAAAEAITEEMTRVAREGLPASELEQAKQQMKGQIMLSLESTGARLHRLSSLALHRRPFIGLDGLLARIDSVSMEDVARVGERYFAPSGHFVLRLGPGEPEASLSSGSPVVPERPDSG